MRITYLLIGLLVLISACNNRLPKEKLSQYNYDKNVLQRTG